MKGERLLWVLLHYLVYQAARKSESSIKSKMHVYESTIWKLLP